MLKAMAESVPLLISAKNMMIFDEFFGNSLIPLEHPGHSSHKNCQNQLIEPPTVKQQRFGDTGQKNQIRWVRQFFIKFEGSSEVSNI